MFYFNKMINKHFVNATAGVEVSENQSEATSVALTGFQLGNMNKPQFAAKQPIPIQETESTSRKIGFLGSVNYSYNDIYLFDGSVRFGR